MTGSTTLHVTVLGASGGIGGAITRELAHRGHAVTAVNRAGDADVPAGVARRAGDLSTRPGAIAAVGAADVVVMAAQPPYPQWVSTWPGLVDHALAGARAAGARLVFVDNLYMYAPTGGPVVGRGRAPASRWAGIIGRGRAPASRWAGIITEDSPEHATDPKGAVRRELGRTLLRAHADGQVRVAIGRFSDYYGPRGVNGSLYVTGFAAGLRGRTMRGLFDLDQPHTFNYLPDAARAFATLVEDPRADGRAWILPAAPAITQRQLFALINDALPRPVRVRRITPTMLRLAGLFNPLVRELRSVRVQFDRPWVTDASRFEAAFGPFATTPHREAVATTVAWFGDRGGARPPVVPA